MNVMKIREFKEIKLDLLEIGQSQARTREVEKGVDELAFSIKKVGLLEPIVVAPLSNGRFEIVTGQRRFLACQKLGLPTIAAQVLENAVDDAVAKAISLTENMVREDMNTRDYVDACTELFRKYGTIKAVSEELGLPIRRVSQYVKFDQLLPSLKEMVNTKKLDLATALRAQKASTDNEGNIDENDAVTLAEEMKGMSSVQQRVLEKAALENTGASTEEIIEIGRKQPRVKEIKITISESLDQALSKYANDEGSNKDEAALSLIESGLSNKGYV